MNSKINYWLGLAEYDFETAIVMLNSKRYLYVGFMLHQCIEKTLKAYYLFLNLENQPPYTHSLLKLAEFSNLYSIMSDDYKDLLDMLEPLNIEARYPTHKERLLKELTHEKCSDLLKNTEELYLWIKTRLTME